MQWGEAQGSWLGVIRTNQHSMWSPKRGQWSESKGDKVEVSDWELALGMDNDRVVERTSHGLVVMVWGWVGGGGGWGGWGGGWGGGCGVAQVPHVQWGWMHGCVGEKHGNRG